MRNVFMPYHGWVFIKMLQRTYPLARRGKWQTCRWSDRDWRSAIFMIRVWREQVLSTAFTSRPVGICLLWDCDLSVSSTPWCLTDRDHQHSLRFWQERRNLDIISEINLFWLSDKQTLSLVCVTVSNNFSFFDVCTSTVTDVSWISRATWDELVSESQREILIWRRSLSWET